MMWRRFARRYILVIPQKLDLLPGRDVQHVNAFAALARELDEPLGGHQRRGLVAPDRMRARITFEAQGLAFVEAILVLGVKRGATADHRKNPAQAGIVLDQQRAGGGADEHFYAGTTRRAFQFRQILNILAGAADEEGEIAMHALGAGLDLRP